MTNKERLEELIINAKIADPETESFTEFLAEYLLANGVIVPPCKVGDTVYVIVETTCEDIDLVHTVCEFYNEKHEDLCTLPKGKCPYKYIIMKCSVDKMNILHFSENMGKTVFLTREEAEKALEERSNNNA